MDISDEAKTGMVCVLFIVLLIITIKNMTGRKAFFGNDSHYSSCDGGGPDHHDKNEDAGNTSMFEKTSLPAEMLF